MDRPLPLRQYIDTLEIATALQSLLRQGCSYIQQGCYAEGATILSLVRAQLVPTTSLQEHLVEILDAFLQGYTSYQYSRQALYEASTRFTEAQREQQERVAVFSNTLSALLESSNTDERNEVPHNDLLRTIAPSADTPSLCIICFGQFEVRACNKPVVLCASRSGQGILRYLAAQPRHQAKSDTLQTLFWPDDEPEVAQRKLHSAISSLRRALNNSLESAYTSLTHKHDVLLYKNYVYALNPEISIQTDVDDFLHLYHVGQQEEQDKQYALYKQACQLYTGPFLSEDLYADWSFLQRERLSQAYMSMCKVLANYYLQQKQYEDAERCATAVLQENRCDEAAYCQLIQIYIAQGRRSEAYRHYQRCEHILREELGVNLLPETVRIFQHYFQDGFL